MTVLRGPAWAADRAATLSRAARMQHAGLRGVIVGFRVDGSRRRGAGPEIRAPPARSADTRRVHYLPGDESATTTRAKATRVTVVDVREREKPCRATLVILFLSQSPVLANQLDAGAFSPCV